MSPVEPIVHNGQIFAYLIDGSYEPSKTEFMTPDEFTQQVGYIVYKKGTAIIPHLHHPVERVIQGTTEVIIVKSGRCEIDFYSDQKELLFSRPLKQDDIAILISGGHGFRMHEDTVLLEVKQGPYVGGKDKERF